MKIVYIADDGTEFDNYYKCDKYEFLLKYPRVQDIVFLDIIGNEISYPMTKAGYIGVETIIVPDQEAADQLSESAWYTGFRGYEDITSAGTWKFHNDPYNPRFMKMGDGR